MAQHHGPFLIAEIAGLAAVLIGQLGGLFNINDKVFPRGGKTLIALRLCGALHQSLNHSRGGHLLTATIKDLFLELSNQRESLVAELDL